MLTCARSVYVFTYTNATRFRLRDSSYSGIKINGGFDLQLNNNFGFQLSINDLPVPRFSIILAPHELLPLWHEILNLVPSFVPLDAYRRALASDGRTRGLEKSGEV